MQAPYKVQDTDGVVPRTGLGPGFEMQLAGKHEIFLEPPGIGLGAQLAQSIKQ